MLKKLSIIVLSASLVLVLTLLNNPPAFIGFSESRAVYTGTSSNSHFKEYPHLACVNKIKGESCKIPTSEFNMEEFTEYFSAKKVRTEAVAETVSYYFVSPKLKNYVLINGQKINLHIAINNEYVVIGSPVIYGGY